MFVCKSLSSYESQPLRSRFAREKKRPARNLTTNFLVNILIYLEQSEKTVRNRYYNQVTILITIFC